MIRILPPEEAKKIAAGEVIDRPAALVRELIDNALDAGAANIELAIDGGGIGKIELIDDGMGMGKKDLALCVTTHATSKITSLDDLSHSTTLGFRGEALAAAAAVARLEIVSSTDGREAWLLETFPARGSVAETENGTLTQTRRNRGTSVRAIGLFDTIPARKRFLKREVSEATLCRQILTEKALAFPGVSFRFTQDGTFKFRLAPCGGEIPEALKNRFADLLLGPGEKNFLHTTETSGKGFSVTIVFGGPELFRKDRKLEFIFANKRRIQDFGLMQALEYGLAGFFPNGTHPVGAVFVEVDPALADFNIHPAKREVRFTDSGAIHHSISTALRAYTHSAVSGTSVPATSESGTAMSGSGLGFDRAGPSLALKALLDQPDEFEFPRGTEVTQSGALFVREHEALYTPYPTRPDKAAREEGRFTESGLRIAGRVFNLFILVERGETLYIIDQHAAHERLLYNQYMAKPPATQELLVPIPFVTASEAEDTFLRKNKEAFVRFGIVLKDEGNGAWSLNALPAAWKTEDPVRELLSLQTADGAFNERVAATLACRSAVMDGDYLDDSAALELATATLALPNGSAAIPRCPHGRPLWTELSREDLFRAVRRTR